MMQIREIMEENITWHIQEWQTCITASDMAVSNYAMAHKSNMTDIPLVGKTATLGEKIRYKYMVDMHSVTINSDTSDTVIYNVNVLSGIGINIGITTSDIDTAQLMPVQILEPHISDTDIADMPTAATKGSNMDAAGTLHMLHLSPRGGKCASLTPCTVTDLQRTHITEIFGCSITGIVKLILRDLKSQGGNTIRRWFRLQIEKPDPHEKELKNIPIVIMMNLISWNVRGIVNKCTFKKLRKLSKISNSSLMAVYEPMTDKDNIHLSTTGQGSLQYGVVYKFLKICSNTHGKNLLRSDPPASGYRSYRTLLKVRASPLDFWAYGQIVRSSWILYDALRKKKNNM